MHNLEENICVEVSFSILLEARGGGLVFNIVKKLKLYGPFLWAGFNYLKATEPLQGGSLLFTPKFSEMPSTVCYYHVTYTFQSESTLYSCLNVKELLARNKRDI